MSVEISHNSQLLTVSVIIPVRNEDRHIRRCLRDVMDTTYPRDKIEIIVVDGVSTDNTQGEVEALHKEGLNVRLLPNPRRTPYTGLNVGIRAAKGEIIARVDARSICPPNYIKSCIDTLLKTGADNVGGVQKPIGDSPRQRAIALAMTHPFGVGDAQFRLGKKSGYVDTVYLGCFRRKLFDDVGLYDEDGPVIGEDTEMNQRIISRGGRVFLNKDIVVSYVVKDTLRAFWRQYFIYGGARAHNFMKSGGFSAKRQLVPLAFLITLCVLLPLAFIHNIFLYLLVLILGTYIGVDLTVALMFCVRNRDGQLLPWLILAFPCMHFGWAFGFFVRLFEGSRPGRHWRK